MIWDSPTASSVVPAPGIGRLAAWVVFFLVSESVLDLGCWAWAKLALSAVIPSSSPANAAIASAGIHRSSRLFGLSWLFHKRLRIRRLPPIMLHLSRKGDPTIH